MSFPEVFETDFKAELTQIPSKAEAARVGLGTSYKERKQYMWTGKTYQHVDDIDYERFINPKTNKPFRFTEEVQNVKEIGSKVVNQVGNVYKSKPVQFFLDQTGLNAAEQIFTEGSISALNWAAQVTPDKVKSGLKSAGDFYDKGILGISQQLDIHPFATEAGLTAIETLGPGAVKNIAKKKLGSNFKNLKNLVSSPPLAVAGGGTVSNDLMPTIFNSVDSTEIFTINSVSANKGLGYKKIAQQYQKVSKLDMPVVKGYKAGNIKEYNKYVKSELEHWAKHGKGSGKYFVLEHATDPTKNIKYRFDNKGARILDGILSEKSFSWKSKAAKSAENKQASGLYRAKKKGAQITLEEYIEELGEELGKKGFELDKQRMRRLRRWIGKNVHLDHIQPISKGGFDHPANMILLYAKDNLSKNAKVLPDSFFTNMKIPKTKQELIRSSLRNPEIPNKVKRGVILELLIK